MVELVLVVNRPHRLWYQPGTNIEIACH